MTVKNRISFLSKNPKVKRLLAFFVFLVILCTFLCGCKDTENTDPTNGYLGPPQGYVASSSELYCLEITTYSGPFVEDGRNEQVENVVAILVENRAKHYLEFAKVTYYVGDKIATFNVTGLPAGKKAWVLEAGKMKLEGQPEFTFLDCESTFKSDAVLTTSALGVSSQENMLTINNKGNTTLKNVCIYYKNVNSDGNYLGGITYMLNFGTLAKGQTVQRESAHFSENSQIVRYSFQDG